MNFLPNFVMINLALGPYLDPDWIRIQHKPDPDSDMYFIYLVKIKRFADV
jgi:hypothetical protein